MNKRFIILLLRWIDTMTVIMVKNPSLSSSMKHDLIMNVDSMREELGDTKPLKPLKRDENGEVETQSD